MENHGIHVPFDAGYSQYGSSANTHQHGSTERRGRAGKVWVQDGTKDKG